IYVGKINESPNTWLIHSGLNDMDNFDVYISSLYFITYTILSIGYGDIVSQNYYERLFNMLFMLIGVMFFSFAISSLASIFSRLDEKAIKLETKLKIITDIVNRYKIPKYLKDKLTKTVKHEVRKTNSEKYEFIENLPNRS